MDWTRWVGYGGLVALAWVLISVPAALLIGRFLRRRGDDEDDDGLGRMYLDLFG